MTLIFYTDGAATMRKINGEYVREAGGWGVICLDENMKEINRLSGGEKETTNNRMELEAIRRALNHYMTKYSKESANDTITIYSDSAYCINIFTQWIKGWEARGWKKADKKPIENLDLIKQIYYTIEDIENISFSTVNFVKVKGHDNVYWNNEADKLAVSAKEAIANGNDPS